MSNLNKIPYRWYIDTDENRAVEGLNLRNDYFKDRGFNRIDTDNHENGDGSPFYTPSGDINLKNLSVWSAALGWLQYGFEG